MSWTHGKCATTSSSLVVFINYYINSQSVKLSVVTFNQCFGNLNSFDVMCKLFTGVFYLLVLYENVCKLSLSEKTIGRPRLPIKILEELPKIGAANGRVGESKKTDNEEKSKLMPNLSPASYFGPDYLKELIGTCYLYLDDKYKYKCCFFDNVTQEEIQSLQEPYKGVLGLWGEWIIENNTFKALHFIEGNKCGSGLKRNIKISLDCGIRNRLKSISEPSKCNYIGSFESPMFCGTNALIVYPRLSKELQQQWNAIETEKHYKLITEKGYDRELQELFQKAGFILSPNLRKNLNLQTEENESHLSCEKAKETLERRVEELEEELELKNIKLREMMEEFHEGNKVK